MSANNQIIINKNKEGKFVARNFDLDCGPIETIIIADTLEEAIKKANDFMEDNEVEYGLNIRI